MSRFPKRCARSRVRRRTFALGCQTPTRNLHHADGDEELLAASETLMATCCLEVNR